MRCLHCGKPLSLLRRASGSEFCSRVHERQYFEVQESLAVARLIEARPGGGGRLRQAPTAGNNRHPSAGPKLLERFLPEAPKALAATLPDWSCSDALQPRFEIVLPQTGLPVLSAGSALPQAAPGSSSIHPADCRSFPLEGPSELDFAAPLRFPRTGEFWLAANPEIAGSIPPAGPSALDVAAGPCRGASEVLPETYQAVAALPRLRLSPALPATLLASQGDPQPADVLLRADFLLDGSRSPMTVDEHVTAPLVVPEMPLSRSVLPRRATAVAPPAGPVADGDRAASRAAEPALVLAGRCVMPGASGIAPAGMRSIASVIVAAAGPVACAGTPAPARSRSLPLDVALDPTCPIRSCAPPSAFPALLRAQFMAESLQPAPVSAEHDAALPIELETVPGSANWISFAAVERSLAPVPEACNFPETPDRLAPLLDAGLDQLVARQDCHRPAALVFPVAFPVSPAMPSARLQPEPPSAQAGVDSSENGRRRFRWPSVAARHHFTRGLVKWLAAALPVFLIPLVRFSTETASAGSQHPPAAVSEPAGSWRQALARRAAIRLEDDFRSGLGAWKGRGNWAETWSYDPAGLVHPGKLALYGPSISLSDYRLEFTGQLERGGMGWVYRARDESNYHAMKLALIESGPLAKAILILYSVTGGRAGPRSRTPLPFPLGQKSMHVVRLELHGTRFSVYVDGQLVHYGADLSLPSGGIGFFAEPGDRFSLRRVRVVHQDDPLGRICAWLAPASADAIRSQTVE